MIDERETAPRRSRRQIVLSNIFWLTALVCILVMLLDWATHDQGGATMWGVFAVVYLTLARSVDEAE